MKLDLKDTTFITPIRIESADRMRNVITSIGYILDNFDTNIIIKEVDSESVFANQVLPQLNQFVDTSNIHHIFEKSDDPVFHRMKYINEMLSMVKTKVTANYDCDILLPKESYLECQKRLVEKTADVVYPFEVGDANTVCVRATDELVTEFLCEGNDFKKLEASAFLYMTRHGFCQFFNTEVYREAGGENQMFIAYGPEDEERFFRFTTLGYKVDRLPSPVYHLEHARTQNSGFTNPYIQHNHQLWQKIQKMNRDEIIEFYQLKL